MSPGEAVRETALRLLADDQAGLNPAFVYQCRKRGIDVPLPGDNTDQDKPFNFSVDSSTVFKMREDINWLERNTNQQYPCIICYVDSEKQDNGKRPYGAKFFGTVIVEFIVYIAWSQLAAPQNNDFEAHLDALSEALIVVLNNDASSWVPVLYTNLLDITQRTPLELCNEGQLLRRGIKARVTAHMDIC